MLVLSPPVGPLTFNGAISQLQYDCAGRLLASVQGAGLFAIDAVTGAATQLALLPVINAMAVDEVTGDVLCTSGVLGSAQMLRITPPQVVVAGMAANDSASGLAVRTSMATIGGASAPCTTQTTQWHTCANPGGAPFIPLAGVNPFSLSLDVAPNATLGVVVFSVQGLPGPTTLSVLPLSVCNVLVGPNALVGPMPLLLPTGVPTTHVLSMPIPAGLQPMTLFAQPLHFDPTQPVLAGGQALEFRVH